MYRDGADVQLVCTGISELSNGVRAGCHGAGADRDAYVECWTPIAMLIVPRWGRGSAVRQPDMRGDGGVCAQLLADDTGFGARASANYTGFHYADWAFAGRDLLLVVRTGYRGASSYHNANRMTTRRVVGYRRVCGTEHLYAGTA